MQWFDQFLHHYITAGGNSERGVLQKSVSVSPGRMIVTTGRMTACCCRSELFPPLVRPISETILSTHLLLSGIIYQVLVYAVSNTLLY